MREYESICNQYKIVTYLRGAGGNESDVFPLSIDLSLEIIYSG